ncbi:MAG TPA: SRPBCC family protein [Solirubrobacterales bacterium]|nr:SRPBCC family protein [Solirubrobacterales bacterium]
MATLTESVLVGATLGEVWDVYFDSRRWASWVDGFAAVERSDGYPQDGATLVWRSNPAGRGTVTERVVEHSPRRLHRIEFTDPESNGELRTRFAVEGEAVRVALELDYRLASGGPFAWLADRLFVRSQVRASLRRSLLGLKREAEEPVG